MNTDLIKEYHKWARQGYVSRLTCPRHEQHELILIQVVDEFLLQCPRLDFSKTLGLAEYKVIQSKVQMAILLSYQRNQ
jgi:hypothetical protein